MPITFASIDDPYGIRGAGGTLAQALMQKSILDRQEKSLLGQEQRAEDRAIRAEQRAQSLKKQYGEVLGKALAVAQDPSLPSAQRMAALQNYVSQTGDTSILPMIKQLGQEAQTSQLLQMLGLQPMGGSQFPASPEVGSTPQVPNQNGHGLARLSEQQLVAAAASGNPQLKTVVDAEFKRRDLDQKKFESERSYHSQRSLPFLKDVDAERDALRKQEFALAELDASIANKETGGFTLNNLSRIFGRPEILTASGAQLAGATKELLISNIGSISGRPNMFLEQQFTGALPELGKSPIANAVLAESLRGNISLAKAKHEITDRLSQEDMDKYGYVRSDISSRVNKEMKPMAQRIEDKAAYRVRELVETEKGDKELRKEVNKKVPSGTPLTRKMAAIFLEQHKSIEKAIDNAKKLGYEIFSVDNVEEFERAK